MDWKRIRAPVLACVALVLAGAATRTAASPESCGEPPPPGYNVIYGFWEHRRHAGGRLHRRLFRR